MQTSMNPPPPMTIASLAFVLIGFPAGSAVLSLLLLHRGSLAWTGLDFFTAF